MHKFLLQTVSGICITASTLAITVISSPAQGTASLETVCRNIFEGFLGDELLQNFEISRAEGSPIGRSTVSFTITPDPGILFNGRSGYSTGACLFDGSDKLTKFDTTSFVAESPNHFQDFGDIPDVGRFIVILREPRSVSAGYDGRFSTIAQDYYAENSVFPVLVNNRREIWWSNCQTNEIGRVSENGNKEAAINQSETTTDISKLVCTEQ